MAVPNSDALRQSETKTEDDKVFDVELKKSLREMRRAMATIKGHGEKIQRLKITAKMGDIPQGICNRNPVPQTSGFFQLATELQQMVWQYLETSADLVSFALTCKATATMHEYLKTRAAVHRASTKTIRKEERLALLLRLGGWMPGKYRLCFTCVRFRLRHGHGDWGGSRKFEKASETITPKGGIKKMAFVQGPRCARCRFRKGIEQHKHEQNVKEYIDIVHKHARQ